jgi:hypothetical protein
MLKKSKMLMTGLSLLLATAAGVANAADPFYNPQLDNGYPSNNCAATGFAGYDLALHGYIYFDIYSLADGESLTVTGTTLWGTPVTQGTFTCSGGDVYYTSGPDYGSNYDWWEE